VNTTANKKQRQLLDSSWKHLYDTKLSNMKYNELTLLICPPQNKNNYYTTYKVQKNAQSDAKRTSLHYRFCFCIVSKLQVANGKISNQFLCSGGLELKFLYWFPTKPTRTTAWWKYEMKWRNWGAACIRSTKTDVRCWCWPIERMMAATGDSVILRILHKMFRVMTISLHHLMARHITLIIIFKRKINFIVILKSCKTICFYEVNFLLTQIYLC
jgi:hypothetical protein